MDLKTSCVECDFSHYNDCLDIIVLMDREISME